MKPGGEVHIQPRVTAEIPEAQVGQMHALSMNVACVSGESFPLRRSRWPGNGCDQARTSLGGGL